MKKFVWDKIFTLVDVTGCPIYVGSYVLVEPEPWRAGKVLEFVGVVLDIRKEAGVPSLITVNNGDQDYVRQAMWCTVVQADEGDRKEVLPV